jgi:hypothetical protein
MIAARWAAVNVLFRIAIFFVKLDNFVKSNLYYFLGAEIGKWTRRPLLKCHLDKSQYLNSFTYSQKGPHITPEMGKVGFPLELNAYSESVLTTIVSPTTTLRLRI